MIVLDASAAVELFLTTELGAEVARRTSDAAETLHAPHLIDIEVAQVMRRYVLAGRVTDARAATALGDFSDLDLTRYPHDVLMPRIWQMRGNVTAYDAAYVALAEALGAVLLTTDARLSRAPGHRAEVELISL